MEFLKTLKTPEGCNPFMWICKYNDENYVPEFEDEETENSFLDIEKEKVEELHLIGNGFHSMFNTKDGSFKINDDTKIDFVIIPKNNKNTIYITEDKDSDYHDIIQYKGFYTDGVSNIEGAANLECHTCSYHIGWKKRFQINDDIDIFFKSILSVIINEGIKLEIKLSSKNDFEGDFIIAIKQPDGNVQSFAKKLNIKKNKSCNFDINLS